MCLLNTSKSCQIVVNICVVVVTFEQLLSITLCKYCYRKSCMSVGSEVHTALVIQDVCDGYCKRSTYSSCPISSSPVLAIVVS